MRNFESHIQFLLFQFNLKTFIYIYVYISSSSSCRAASTDIPDPLLPLLHIVHRLWQVFRAKSRILTQLLNVCSSWPSCFCSATCGGPQQYITCELVPASPAVSCVSGSSNLDSFRDGRQVAVQLVLCGVLPPGLVQYCSQYSYVIAVQLFLQSFSQHPSSESIQQYRYDRCLWKKTQLRLKYHHKFISTRKYYLRLIIYVCVCVYIYIYIIQWKNMF